MTEGLREPAEMPGQRFSSYGAGGTHAAEALEAGIPKLVFHVGARYSLFGDGAAETLTPKSICGCNQSQNTLRVLLVVCSSPPSVWGC